MGPNSFSSTICWKGDCICKFRTKVQSHMKNIFIFLELLKKFDAKSTLELIVNGNGPF